MRSERIPLNSPIVLTPCFEERAKELGYPSVSAYFIGLGLYDLMIAKPHHATGYLTDLTRAEQDKLHDEVARAYNAGETMGGSWFENRIKAATEAAGLAKPPPASRVAEKIQRMIAE